MQLEIFTHDNAPPHTSRVAREFLETEGVTTLNWSACSSDLNPIENLLNIMIIDRRDNLGNVTQLILTVSVEYENIQGNVDN